MIEKQKFLNKLVLQYQHLLGMKAEAHVAMSTTLSIYKIGKRYRKETSTQILEAIAEKEKLEKSSNAENAPDLRLVKDLSKSQKLNPVLEDLGFYGTKAA